MDIKNLIERLLLFIIGVPLVLALPIFFHQLNFLLLFIVCMVVILYASYEMQGLIAKRYTTYKLIFFFIVEIFDFVLVYVFSLFKVEPVFFALLYIIPIFLLSILELAISQREGFAKSFERILTGVLILFYPIFLANFFLFMITLPNPRVMLAVFFICVFSCDSLAWFFGMLFGNGNRNIIAASPKKSIAGFIGVAISVSCVSLALYYFLPQYFPSLFKNFILIGISSFAAVIGDLFESILKRAINVKDSGAIVLGRGGILDTIDSLLFAAPTYFLLCCILL